MPSSSARLRPLASSPFKPAPEPTVEQFACGDTVSHDAYGVGRVVNAEAVAVTVDFGTQTVRIPKPFPKMTKL